MSAFRSRRLIGAVLAVAIGLALPAWARADSAARMLAVKFAPVLSLEPQAKACGSGEAYRPTSVDIVLGRHGVVLRDPRGRLVKRAPSSRDLWGLGPGYYLDFPGNPLDPGCNYERQFRHWNRGREPIVYAHVATDPAYPGRLAVQYWFYYTFNDFTDKHESDWEMAQVDFAAADPAAALAAGPYEVDLSQHAGGERSAWSDAKLDKRGTHPVIYDATGSHANYFGRALYLGRGAREGFGCDDTREATQQLPLSTVLLPDVLDPPRLRTPGWHSRGAGASGSAASTTVRPGPPPRCSGRPRSSGHRAYATRASRSRAVVRSASASVTSSAGR